jgi:hypothetical protein
MIESVFVSWFCALVAFCASLPSALIVLLIVSAWETTAGEIVPDGLILRREIIDRRRLIVVDRTGCDAHLTSRSSASSPC